MILGARVLAEFGDDPTRSASAKPARNYAGTSPISRQSGKKKTVLARYVHQDRLIDALHAQAFAALNASPGARAYYDHLRARDVGHRAALRQLANRLTRNTARLPQDRNPLQRGDRLDNQATPVELLDIKRPGMSVSPAAGAPAAC